LLRQAAGAAASRFAGDDALRLFRMAADAALTAGDRAGAARDLATMMHGMRGDDGRRAAWVRLTIDLGAARLTPSRARLRLP